MREIESSKAVLLWTSSSKRVCWRGTNRLKALVVVQSIVLSARLWGASQFLTPPGWKDASTTIDTIAGIAESCAVEGYSWTTRVGPDFSVYSFSNSDGRSSSAGFYLGRHPAFSLEVKSDDLGTEFGELNQTPVLWIRKPSQSGYAFTFQTLMSVPTKRPQGSTKLHFWLNIENEEVSNEWLQWASCFRLIENTG